MKTMGIVFSDLHDKDISELTSKRTLASVPFAGRYRLIDFVLSNMVNSGISKVGVITKHNYQSLMDHVGSGKNWDLSRKNGGLMILPPFNAGDGSGAVYQSRFQALKSVSTFIKRSQEDYVIMSDCDIVSNFDYNKVVQYHINKHADITVVYYNAEQKGTKARTALDVDSDGRVKKVTTSDKLTGKNKYFSNILVCSTRFLSNILETSNETGYTSFSRDVLIKGASLYRIFGYEMSNYFAIIDSLAGYYSHNLELLDKEKRDDLFNANGAQIYTKVRDSAPLRIENCAKVSNSLIADGCIIEGEVTNSILFRGVRVSKGSKISNSIIMQDTTIGRETNLNCIIADKNAVILDKRNLSGHSTHPYFIAKGAVI